MFGITLSAEEIKAAPSDVRRWLEQEVASTLRPTAAPVEAASKDPGELASVAAHGEVKMSATEKFTRDEEIRNLIAVRAYELWENQGRPSGHDVINWREAEQEIMSCVGNGPGPAGSPATKAKSPPPGSKTKRLPTSAAAGEI
ncbi:MAG TPA: hypothetical protein DDZ81_01340 [Acetobacteraceae bacterium]|jgi:hypothetical protein|nr:hypothetical protein [Acetobacteraceae bacterium]